MNEKTTQKNDPTLPLWRVGYQYVVGHNLRTGTYILPAATAQEAKNRAEEVLCAKNAGPYRVLLAKPF